MAGNWQTAISAFRAGDYIKSTKWMLAVLDDEPGNWTARICLGIGYFKLKQYSSAQRAFRYVWDNCPDKQLKGQSCLAMQAAAARIEKACSPWQTSPPFKGSVHQLPPNQQVSGRHTVYDGDIVWVD